MTDRVERKLQLVCFIFLNIRMDLTNWVEWRQFRPVTDEKNAWEAAGSLESSRPAMPSQMTSQQEGGGQKLQKACWDKTAQLHIACSLWKASHELQPTWETLTVNEHWNHSIIEYYRPAHFTFKWYEMRLQYCSLHYDSTSKASSKASKPDMDVCAGRPRPILDKYLQSLGGKRESME